MTDKAKEYHITGSGHCHDTPRWDRTPYVLRTVSREEAKLALEVKIDEVSAGTWNIIRKALEAQAGGGE